MAARDRKKLGEILVHLGVLAEADVDRVLEALKRRPRRHKFGQVAREMGLLDEEHILAALAVQMDLFRGIGELSLQEILRALQSSDAPSGPRSVG
ncbi:MAG TPA: hypothetical protein VFA26_11785 [Gemmataceae bacterium]|nr:hypothetical protein [Gemmataceae bacterium]